MLEKTSDLRNKKNFIKMAEKLDKYTFDKYNKDDFRFFFKNEFSQPRFSNILFDFDSKLNQF
jgi:hypothetical protein